jgi:trans-2,3-dihydro-3-hydroxyanthranilate isomerase
MRLRYEVVDVFTDRPFAGNPLAVVYGADDLAGDQLQAIAREFNLSETIFALAPTTTEATYRVRIFTPGAEIPFAGHPSVGVAVTLCRAGRFPAGTVIQECAAGLLPVTVAATGSATLTGATPSIDAELDPGPLLAAVGLTGADYAGPAARRAGCGLDFTYLPVAPGAVARAAADAGALRSVGADRIDVFAWDPASATAHVRVFAPALGVPEDPATGSAALGLGAYLVAEGLLPPDGESAYTITQGVEMGRPSVLECSVVAAGGVANTCRVAGAVVPVSRGEITPPD